MVAGQRDLQPAAERGAVDRRGDRQPEGLQAPELDAFHDKLAKATKDELSKVFDEEIEGLKAIDDYTLQLKLTKPYPSLMHVLSMSFTSPVPREAVEAYADKRGNLLDHPVGTGPFVLKKWERNHEVTLVRNPVYRKDIYPSQADEPYRKLGLVADAGKSMPFVDQISVEIIKEDQPRWLNFMKGKTDILLLPKDNFKQAVSDQGKLTPELEKKGINLSVETGVVIRYISFNMKDKLIGSNKYLRQALSAAIDRNQWISVFTNGTGKKMVSAVPPGIANRPKTSLIKYDYNLAQAKELLKKAGYPNGQGLPPIQFDLAPLLIDNSETSSFVSLLKLVSKQT